jgi:hypothetical protein
LVGGRLCKCVDAVVGTREVLRVTAVVDDGARSSG